MDFENMKRKQLQALCKEHGISANLTNLEMVNKLSSLLKVNDEKPLTRGRSCLKILDENVNDRESDVVSRKVKKVKFSPDNEIIEFTRSARVGRGGRRKTMLYKNNLNVESDGVKVGILDSPVRVTRSQRMNMEDGVTEKKGRTRHAKDSLISVNESKDEVGVTTKRTLKNKEVVIIQEKSEENEGVDDGLRMSRRVRSRKNAKEGVVDSQEELKTDVSEKEIDRAEKRGKKVIFSSGGQTDDCTKSESKAKETKRVTRRKSMAHNQTSHVQIEVDAEVREEVVEKPARVTRSRNLKPVEDNVSNKRNRARGKEAIQTNEELLCSEFVESSVEAVKDEVRVNTRRSQKNSVLEAPEKALKRAGRVANKEKGARLSDDVTKEKMVTRGRTRNHSNLTVEASTSESVEFKRKHEVVFQLEEPVEVPLRRSDRRKSVFPLEKLRGDEVAAKKEKRNFLNANEDELRQKGIKEEPQKALKRSKRLATQVEDSVLAKDDIAENKIDRPTESQGTLEVVPQTGEVPIRSNRCKSVVPSLEKVRSDEVVVIKEKKNLNANDGEIRSKGTKEEAQKTSKRSKRLAKQMEDPVLAKRDIANANVDTKILDSSVQVETSVVKEERRRSGRSATRHTLTAISDDKKEKGENKLTKRNCTVIQEKDSTNKFTLQDLDSPKQSMSSSKASDQAAVVKKTSTAGKKQQGRLKRSSVEVEVPMPEDMEIVGEPHNNGYNISGSGGTMSFSRSSLNELEAVPHDVNIVLASTKDDAAAESSTLPDKLIEEGSFVDANSSPSENNSASKSLPFGDPFNSDARPEENLVEELLQSDHEEPASEGLCPSSALADDAVPNDLISDRQDLGASAADNAEEFVTGLSNDVLDNCSLSQSYNMGENLDFGTKDDAAAESSTLADKLIEEGPFVDANASPSENNSTSDPFSDSFNSNSRPEENLVEEVLQCDHEAPAGKDLCSSPVLAEDAVPNEITSDEQELGSIALDNAEGLSDEVLDNCSLSQSDNMEENPDSGHKEQLEAGCVVTDVVTYGEQEPASKGLCPSSSLADDAVPNDINSDKQEHGAVVADNAEEVDTGLSNEVLDNCSVNHSDNMEEKLDSGFKEQSVSRCIDSVGVNYGEQGLTVTDYAKEFDAGLSSNVCLGNVGAFNQSDEMEVTISEAEAKFGHMEQAEAESVPVEAKYDLDAPTFTSQGEIHAEECANLEAADSEKTVSSPIKAFQDLQEPGILGDGITLHVTPSEDSGEDKQGEELKSLFATPCYVSHSKEEKKASLDGDSRDEDLNREGQVSPISGYDTSVLQSSVRDGGEQGQEPGILADGITLHVTPSEDSDEDTQGEELESLFATPCYVSHSKEEKKASLDGDSRDEDLNREGQVSPISGYDTSGLQSSVRDRGEHGQEPGILGDGITLHATPSEDSDEDKQGEELKGLFATPCYVSHSKEEKKASLDGDSRDEDLNREGQVSPISGYDTSGLQSSVRDGGEHGQVAEPGIFADGITLHVTPSEDSDEDKQGEELKSLFATPCYVSHSKEEKKASLDGDSRDEDLNRKGQVSPISGYDTSGLQSSVSDCGKHGQGVYLKNLFVTPFGSRSSKVEIATGIAINETSSQYKHSCHENENTGEDLKGLFATPSVVSQSVGDQHYLFQSQLSGEAMTKREGLSSSRKENSSESVRGLIENMQVEHVRTLFDSPVAVKCTNQETTCSKGKYSQSHEMKTYICSGVERNLGESEAGSVGVDQAPETSSHITSFKYGGQSYVQEIVDTEEHKIEETVADRDLLLFSSQEPKTADVAMSREMVRDTEMNTRHESSVQEIGDIEEHKMEEMLADRDLLQRGDISRGLKEDVYVGIANERSSPVISGPTCDDIGFSEQQTVLKINWSSPNESTSPIISEPTSDDVGFSEQQMVPEISKSSLENVKTSDAFNEGTEDHLKLLFATPIKATSPSRLSEASSCQLKTAAIAMASEMAGKQPKQGFEFSGEQLTVEIISGGSDRTKKSCFSKEIEQFEGGPLFPTPSKGTCPLQSEESPGCEEDILNYLDGVKFPNFREQNFAQHGDRHLLNELTDDAGEATPDWFQTNDGNVPTQTELDTQKENDSSHLSEPLHEEGEVTEDDALAEGNEDGHLEVYQESPEDGLINTDEAAMGGAVSEAVCEQSNIPLTDIKDENVTQESTRKTDGISVSAESGILEFDAESSALRSQETIIITVEETKGDEVQKLEVRNISNAFLQNIPNDGEYAKTNSTALPADEQFHLTEPYVVENVSSTEEFTASTNECQHVSKEGDLAAEGERLVCMNVGDSGLTSQMDLAGIFAGESSNKTHSALSEEPQSGSDQGKFSAAKQQDDDSFDKKVHESTEAVLSPSSKSRENISFIKEGIADEGTLMFEKKDDLAEKKEPLTPVASVAKTSFAKHLNSTVKKKNARSILIHGTPNKLTQIADMKENAPSVKGDIGTLTALRPEKRPALKDLPWK